MAKCLFIFLICTSTLLCAEESYHTVSLGWQRNDPAYTTINRFAASSTYFPSIGYNYHAPYSFMLGFSGQFKRFFDREKEEIQPFLFLCETVLYKIRLYEPYYGLIGGQLLYIYPLREIHFPLHRQKGYSIDLGVSAMMGMMGKITPKWEWGWTISRWRGTKSNLWHGTEASIFLAYIL